MDTSGKGRREGGMEKEGEREGKRNGGGGRTGWRKEWRRSEGGREEERVGKRECGEGVGRHTIRICSYMIVHVALQYTYTLTQCYQHNF